MGTRWYTRHYPALLPRQRCITLDIDPAAARHGSPGEHLVANVRASDCRLATDNRHRFEFFARR